MSRGKPPPPSSLGHVARTHLADGVFEALAGSLLRGELAPEAKLPTEAALAATFGTTRIIVRQAIHRLAELGLVRVRQGSPTRVADPETSLDLRVFELRYRLSASSSPAYRSLREAMREKMYLSGLGLIESAHHRGSAAGRTALLRAVDEMRGDAATAEGFERVDERFWKAIAELGGNRLLQAEIAWWFGAFAGPRPNVWPREVPFEARYAAYREIARRLAAPDDPVGHYLGTFGPALYAQGAHFDDDTEGPAARRPRRK